jgi:hypothetical protein
VIDQFVIDEKGCVGLDVVAMIAALGQKHRAYIIQALACQQEVMDEVMNQVLDGYTTDGWYGPKGYGGNPDATHGIDGARMRIAKGASKLAAEEIDSLKRAIESAKKLGQKGWDAYHEAIRRY